MKNNKKVTKTEQVKAHLVKNGSITSWESISLYKATRLSDIIYRLRDKDWNIKTENVKSIDVNGNKCNYAKYVYTAPKF